jgi:hypothetical protein
MPTAAAVAAIMAATATSIRDPKSNRRFLPLNQAAQSRINGSNHGKHSDSEQQAEKHNLCSLVTEQANAGSRQIQRGDASEHSHRAKKDRRR